MSPPILRVQGLDHWFGGVHAIDGVDLEVATGSLHAIIGPNGSGKTTLFNLITGHTRPDRGNVWFDGRDISGVPYPRVVRQGIAKSYQITTVFPLLTVFENVRVAAQAMEMTYVFWRPAARVSQVVQRAEEALERVGLLGVEDETAGNLSHGDLRKLDLAIALATRPRLLLLDEPTAGMGPTETGETVQLIEELRQDHTIMMIEHKMNIVLGIADRITVLHQGQKLFEGPPARVRDHPTVQEVYLTGAI